MSESIDILKLQDTLEKERLMRFLKNKENLSTMLIISIGEISGLMQGFPANLIVNLTIPVLALGLFARWKDKSYIINEITDVIRNSLEYQQCTDLYNNYIKRLASLIRDLGFNNSREIVLYFDALQNGGILSQDCNNVYYNYKYDNVTTTELLGARAVSGKCVCRHSASFAADLFNELGLIASPLIVKRDTSHNPEEKLHRPIEWTHALVGIYEKGQKFLYDPTGSLFADQSDVEFKDIRYSDYIAKPTGDEFAGHYLIYPGNKMFFNRKYKDQSYAIASLPLMRLDKKELEELHKEIENILTKRLDDIISFMMQNKSLLKEITKLESSISPHSDEPIKNWMLTKSL